MTYLVLFNRVRLTGWRATIVLIGLIYGLAAVAIGLLMVLA